MTDPHETVVAAVARCIKVVACAGSGKTEVLARRAVRLLREGVPPDAIVAFTFTNKAAQELRSRIETRAGEADPSYLDLPPTSRGLFVGTLHGWALQALQSLGGAYGNVDPLSEEEEWSLAFRLAHRLGLVGLYRAAVQERPELKVATAPAVTRFLRTLDVVRDECIDLGELERAAPDFARAMRRYEDLLTDMRLLPYRQMIARAAEELRPGGALFERLEGRVRHVLVDEVQDLNRAQHRILERLLAMGASVTAVGDDDQAIYQWRGGDVRLFVGLRADAVLGLHRNLRCRPEIVALATRVVERLEEREPKPLEAMRGPAPGGAVELCQAGTPDEEARQIAARIRRLLDEGIPPAEIAVLYRSVRTSAEPLIQALAAARVPFAVVGKTSLLSQPTMGLLARIFVYWSRSEGWYPDGMREVVTADRLAELLGQACGLSREDAAALLPAIEELGREVRGSAIRDLVEAYDRLLSVLGLPRKERSPGDELALGRMSELLAEFQRGLRRALPAGLHTDLTQDGRDEAALDDRLRAAFVGPEEGEARHEVAPDRGSESPLGDLMLRRLRHFLEEFAGRAAEVSSENDPRVAEAVQIMTVHQAKGLEFTAVFLPSLVDKRFPSSLAGQEQVWLVPTHLFDRRRYEGRMEDEARLFYVGLTRARELLVLSCFATYPKGDRARPSPFLATLAPHLSEARRLGEAATPVVPARRLDSRVVELDFSSFSQYRQCGYRYWLSRVCGFQPLLDAALGFGRALHHIVAEWAREATHGRPPGPEAVPEALERHLYLPLAGPVPRSRLREAARRRLTVYLERHGHELARAVGAELPFEVQLRRGGVRVRMQGRVDLLLRPEGPAGPREVEVVDFKTGREGSDGTGEDEDQLRVYGAALARLGWEPRRLFLHDLTGRGGRSAVAFDARELARVEDAIVSAAEGILEGAFEPRPEPARCGGCDFRWFCAHAVTSAAPTSARSRSHPPSEATGDAHRCRADWGTE